MQFVMIDEVNWLHRSATFYDALNRRDWADTLVNTSPGVITTWVGALAFKIEAPYYRLAQDSMVTSYSSFEAFLVRQEGNPLLILRTARVIMVSLLTAVTLLSFLYAKKILGLVPALAGFLLIALDPYTLALTRMNHLDEPVAVFMLLSLLAFIYYLGAEQRGIHLLISGIAGGLCAVAKITGLFLIPIIGVLALWGLYWRRVPKLARKKHWLLKIPQFARILSIWGLAFSFIIFVIWPALWVNPVSTIDQVVGTVSNNAGTINDPLIELAEQDKVEVTGTLSHYIRYPLSFLWRTTPIVLLGLLFSVYALAAQISIFKHDQVRRAVFALLLQIFLYTILVSAPNRTGEKYYAPVYLTADIIAGLGWYAIARQVKETLTGAARRYALPLIFLAVLVLQTVWVAQSFPYYDTFYNPLLGGLEKRAQYHLEGLHIGIGEGLDEIGRYLGAKSGSSQFKVLSWYGVGPFSYYFDGQVTSLFMSNSDWTPEFVRQLQEMDYLITYINQKQRNQPPELFEILQDMDPVYTVYFNEVAYAWLYEVEDLSLPK